MTCHLFLIDDDEDLRDVLKSLLTSQGFTVSDFADARKALASLRLGHTPSVIVLDLMMPGMSGWEFFKQLRADAHLASLPVVMITATRPSPLAALANLELLHKPFAFEHLVEILNRHRLMRQPGPHAS